MATSTITGTITDPTGTAVASVPVTCRLMPTGGFRTATGTEVARAVSTTTNGSGVYTFVLERNSGISPANTYYEVTEQIPVASGGPKVWNISVGASDQTVYAALTTPLAAQTATYLTQDSADARYQALGGLSSSTPASADVADAGTAGVSSSASRADHEHPVPTAAPVATGNANAAGSATTHSRSDHVHKGTVTNDVWTTYTPTLTQSGSVTKTVTYAAYQRTGRMITVTVNLAVTGTGTGANQIIVGLPVAASASAVASAIGSGYVFDTSASFFYTGVAYATSASTIFFLATSANGVLGQAVMTAALASGDAVSFTATYEAAS